MSVAETPTQTIPLTEMSAQHGAIPAETVPANALRVIGRPALAATLELIERIQNVHIAPPAATIPDQAPETTSEATTRNYSRVGPVSPEAFAQLPPHWQVAYVAETVMHGRSYDSSQDMFQVLLDETGMDREQLAAANKVLITAPEDYAKFDSKDTKALQLTDVGRDGLVAEVHKIAET